MDAQHASGLSNKHGHLLVQGGGIGIHGSPRLHDALGQASAGACATRNHAQASSAVRLPAPGPPGRVRGEETASESSTDADAVEHVTGGRLLGRARGDSLLEESSVVFSEMLASPVESPAAVDKRDAVSLSDAADSPHLDA
jgi:hypothetical protein